jgi:glycosyltransferase involved in cell wall biosynthesis
MIILHIHKFFDYRGGAEQYLHRLMEKQARAGHEVHVLSTRSPENAKTEDAKYFVRRFDFTRFEGWRRDLQKGTAFLWNREARRAAGRMIAEIKPDVIHLHNVYHHLSSSILASVRASGVPCVQTLHDFKLACPNYSMFTQGSPCERCKGGRYWNAVFHRCLFPSAAANALAAAEMGMTKLQQSYERTVRAFICLSVFLRDKMIEWGEPASKFVMLPNAAEAAPFPAQGGGGYILYVGRLTSGKGAETLIRASARVPAMPLRIAGTGPEEERFRHLARSLHAAHITFHGFVKQKGLADLRARAEAVAIPSVQYENSPLTVLEALGQGVPALASKNGGIPELMDDGVEGLFAVPGDVDAWTALLKTFLSLSPSERRAMGERGRQRVKEKHGWKEHLKGLEKIYQT